MLIFKSNSSVEAARIVLVFGCGLIGNSIIRHLEWNDHVCVQQFRSFWTESGHRKKQYASLARFVKDLAGDDHSELHFVWSAGTGGFASSKSDLENERDAFTATAKLFESLLPEQPAVFHFFSSAGGLFEGQTLVEKTSLAQPRRPYGEMKQSQEELIGCLGKISNRMVKIYRPSTVYGAHEFNYRSGLISHLIWNAIRNYPTSLEMNVHALRDYVYVDDVGRYIVRQIRIGFDTKQDKYYLVSGKPSSIFEITNQVQKLIGRSLIYQFSSRDRNDADITFSREILPIDWSPTGLEIGLAAVLMKTTDAYLQNTALAGAEF